MAKAMLDAVKTAKSIHKGDYSSLRDKSFLICDKIKNNKGRSKHVKKRKSKYTLNQLGMTVDKLGATVDKLSTKVDQIGDALFAFIKTTNARFDSIEARLDYNGLKKLPKSK